MATNEVWEMTRDEYLAPYRAAVKTADDAYDALYYKYKKTGAYPLGGDFWTRYGHSVDSAAETTELRLDPDYRRLQQDKRKAQSNLTSAIRNYEKAIKKALREKKHGSEGVLQSMPR